MYIIDLNYVCDLNKVNQYTEAHRAHLDRQYALGVFLASGGKVPRTGGVILAKAMPRETLEQIIANDPYIQEGVADYVITDFSPTKTSPELAFLQLN
ncbi:YciI family protein [Celerinatantimonas yamalensis]|uniref:YciI family protein n=1 Tax=Celerinatantimonas yamalensis TaxID=559956 RepID=A0ABW9G5S1_9GAMM